MTGIDLEDEVSRLRLHLSGKEREIADWIRKWNESQREINRLQKQVNQHDKLVLQKIDKELENDRRDRIRGWYTMSRQHD